jgi:hypothetical protein
MAAPSQLWPCSPRRTGPSHIDEASRSAAHFGRDKMTYERAEAFYAVHPSMNHVRTLRSVIDSGRRIMWPSSCRLRSFWTL